MLDFKSPSLLVTIIVGILGIAAVVLLMNGRVEKQTDSLPTASQNQVAGQPTVLEQSNKYQEYSQQAFAEGAGNRRVLFFYAPWCPTCKPTNQDLLQNASQLPDDVIVYRVDYDTSKALKQQYGVTYQHTFVQVDGNGDKIKIWNGGQVAEIIANIL